jgi:glutamine synthetase
MYHADGVREIPKTLREAAELAAESGFLRSAFGDQVVDHYVHAARWEVLEHDRVVTDWEVQRGLERA